MATTSSLGEATRSPDGRSQTIRAQTQYRRDFDGFAGSVWHHRARGALPFTEAAPQRRYPPSRPCPRSAETGTNRVQRLARNTATAIHIRRFHTIHQPPRLEPPVPGEGSHISGSRPQRRRSIPSGTEAPRRRLPNGEPSLRRGTDGRCSRLPPHGSRPPTHSDDAGDDDPSRSQNPIQISSPRSFQTEITIQFPQAAETSETPRAGQGV